MSLIEVTRRVVDGSMQGVYSFLKFTTETGEDFGDDWLPTLDLSLRVDARGQVLWKFYEKPTASDSPGEVSYGVPCEGPDPRQ